MSSHLDRALAHDVAVPMGSGRFVQEHEQAMQRRRLFLIEQGFMAPTDHKLTRESVSRLADLEMRGLAKKLSSELGVPVTASRTASVRGVYARPIDLAQGRVALVVGDRTANLVPWRATLERFAGREVVGQFRGGTMSWGLARAGPSLPPM